MHRIHTTAFASHLNFCHARNHLRHSHGHEKMIRPRIPLVKNVRAAHVREHGYSGAQQNNRRDQQPPLEIFLHRRIRRIHSPQAIPMRTIKIAATSAIAMRSQNAPGVWSV